jgi:hypothetical protein
MAEPRSEEFDWDAFIGDTLDASAAAVGAWLRCLYRMRRSTERGQLTRNMVGYGRLFGTSPDQAKAIIDEIRLLEIGEVESQQNGEVTLTNRRMHRKFLADKSNAERQARFKDKQKPETNNGSVTGTVTPRLQTPHISLNQNFEEEAIKREEKKKKDMCSPDILRVFTFWQTRLNHPKALLTNDRKGVIAARLKDGYSVEDLEKAIEGCRSSSYHMGQNDQGQIYDSIGLILRNGSKVEQFIGYAESKNNGTSIQNGTKNGKRTDADVLKASAEQLRRDYGDDPS